MPALTSFSFLYEDPSTTEDNPETPLIGTKWTALEVPLSGEPALPITLSLTSNAISGSAGCNKYRGSIEVLSGNSFRITNDVFATTKMHCDEVMEQERDYLNFLKTRTFFYEVTGTGENIELVLFSFDSAADAGGEPMQGKMLARYAKAADSDVQRSEAKKNERRM